MARHAAKHLMYNFFEPASGNGSRHQLPVPTAIVPVSWLFSPSYGLKFPSRSFRAFLGLMLRLTLGRIDVKYCLHHDRCADGRAVHTVHDAYVARLDAEKLDKEVRGAVGDGGVKLWDTEAVARAISTIVGPTTSVLSLQNGVQKDDILRHILGIEPILGGVCYIAATIAQPGVISHTGTMQKLVFGEYDGSRSMRAEAFFEACQLAGIDVELSEDIRKAIWEKFVFLVGLSATTTTVRLPIGSIRGHPQTRRFLLETMREVVAVGRAQGVALAADYAEDRTQCRGSRSLCQGAGRARRRSLPDRGYCHGHEPGLYQGRALMLSSCQDRIRQISCHGARRPGTR
jgi:Ketopantoate reductase PanE/ApbA/Ketopantoate reductase PanE/ApbA C terminal